MNATSSVSKVNRLAHSRIGKSRSGWSGPARQAGFGIVEVMVSVVIGLILVAGILTLFVNNQQMFAVNDSLARMQENARTSFELMAREIRQAGGNVCGARKYGNVTASTSGWAAKWENGIVIGNPTSPSITKDSGTDAIQILSGNTGVTHRVTAYDAGSYTLTLDDATGLADDDLVMICDGDSAAIAYAKVSGKDLKHDGTKNCTEPQLGYPTDCAAGTPKTVSAGGAVTKITGGVWYVNAKKLHRLDINGTDEVIADGVTDLQLDYLFKTAATGTLETEWTDQTDSTPTNDDFKEDATKVVVAVRIKLVLEGENTSNGAAINRTLYYVANLRDRTL